MYILYTPGLSTWKKNVRTLMLQLGPAFYMHLGSKLCSAYASEYCGCLIAFFYTQVNVELEVL